ncbi:MAG: PAS domain S-box protein [Gemmatimonadetes bacterium]|nr:PAS domain S-box protein [Gemmatimonadota bacterium]
MLVWALGHRDVLDLSLVAWATAGSLTLVGIRQLRTVQHAVRLGDRLEASRAGLEISVRERTAELESTTASLRESEERLRDAQRVATVGSWEIDLVTGIVRWSDELFRLQRRPLALGAPSYEGLPRNYTRASWEQLSVAVEQLRTTGEPFELDLEVIRDDGTPWWQAARGEAVRAATGEIVGLRGAVVDITERKRAEEVLHRSQTLLQSVTEGTPDAVFVKDTEGRYLLLNSAAGAFLGAPSDELLGKDDTVLFPPDKARELMDADRAIMASGVTRTYEDLLTMGGLERTVLVTKGPVRDALGAIVGVFGVSRDISARKRAEVAVRESEARYRTLFEQAGDHILVLELAPGGPPIIRDANEAALRAHGYTRDELIGQPISLLDTGLPPDVAEQVHRQLRANRSAQFEVRHRCKDGSFIEIEVSSTPMMIDGVLHTMSTHRDITERKRAAAERARLEGELRQAQKMESVGRLAGGVAHDFNNMLGVIMGHAELAMDQVDPSQPLYDDLAEIHKVARRSGDLTRQLLAFARKQTIMPKVLNLNETVSGMLKMLDRLIGEDITITWSPGADLWAVKMDPSQIDQMLANLCVNARDAIVGVGRVSIETSNHCFDDVDCVAHPGFVPGEYVRLAVTDDGCGMEQETLDHVFEPFFTTKGIGQGTGLGLATVYGAVKQNDGFVDAASQVGRGTTFALYLPRHGGLAGSAVPAGVATPAPRGHETILLAEDESAVLRLTTTMLQRQGYTVLAASTPAEAIRLARDSTRQIHLLLTDMVMPEMNGRELAQAIRAFLPRIDVMFMSGYTADVIARSGPMEDGVALIAKPFGAREIATRVRQVLDRTVEPESP